ncbi:uncharacterized protein LOC126655540 [Mercurialis annua]|uniref:uncharacterized protein LOC126655540 n=1 Tax=Mercurialis annua TaxID=3986 RepID=UPI002160CFE5|nr:uncharacterized protein LOC126655540 [Mercurialis annua]
MFDPKRSFTYDPLPCESHECGSYQSHNCQRQCGFSVNNSVKGERKVTDVDSNILLLGGGGDMEGTPTPMNIYDYYSITLLRIEYGAVVIDMDEEVHKYRAILNTGSPLTYIPDIAYKVLSDTVESQLVTLRFERADDKDDLFFEGKIEGVAIPNVTFSFANGYALVLDEYSLFYSKTPNKFCLAVYPSSNIHSAGFKTLILIGLLAQQNYNVGYDLKNGKLYFKGWIVH